MGAGQVSPAATRADAPSSRRRGDGVEVTVPPWADEILFYAGRHVYLRRLEARDDLGALVRQAGEGARVHRRLRQRGRGVAGSLYEEHLYPVT